MDALARDLMLAETTGVRLMVDCLSTERSLGAVARARKNGVKVSCSVAAYSLFFNELDVGDYLTYCKVQPPFRTETDRMALIDGLRQGIIDAVVSAHDPQPPEDKRLPIAEAAYGAIGLETLLPCLLSLSSAKRYRSSTRCVPSHPARRSARPAAGQARQGRAGRSRAVRSHRRRGRATATTSTSRSKNSPFDGRKLEGRVLRTWVDGETVFERG
jgi:dihydroorotase